MKFVVKEGVLEIAGVDLSDHVTSIDIPLTKDQIDATGLNAGGGHDWVHGLADEGCVVEFMNDEDSGSVTDTLFPLYRDEDEFEITYQNFQGAVSDENPSYRMTAKLFNYDPVNGQVGALSKSQTTFKVIGLVDRVTT
ncbi:MAG TPA: hypothetical protein VH063_18950 [Gaiellaceae bacterium]|jgi:hypothetical protein|nr:hypothetical protein [Gaiellaceae bacterium]